MSGNQEITTLIDRTRGGDGVAFSRLVEQIYDELRAIARGHRRRLGASDTINTTAVVHEAYEKMAGAVGRARVTQFVDRGHFYRVASRVMRDIIVDYARGQSAEKRGGPGKPVSLQEVDSTPISAHTLDAAEVLSVHALLEQLETMDEEAARVTELRYFAGLTTDQAAEALGISPATVKRRWTIARAWLYHKLTDDSGKRDALR